MTIYRHKIMLFVTISRIKITLKMKLMLFIILIFVNLPSIMESEYEKEIKNRPVIFTAEEMREIYQKNGHIFCKIGSNEISWRKKDIKSMIGTQLTINDMILSKKLNANEIIDLKKALRMLTDNITEYYTSTCSVCKHKLNTLVYQHNETEHVTIKESWGYLSLYDTQTHELVLCCNCYKTHIMDGSLGKFVKHSRYM